MRKLALAAALGAAFSTGAWGQAPPSGTYQFISGAGVGTPPFTVSGFSTSLGGSIGGIHIPNCAGIHVHGVFNSFADPNSGGCGHGIIQLIVPPPAVSGGGGSGSGLPGGAPNNVAGQLALTSPIRGLAGDRAGDAFVNAVIGFAQTTDALLDVARNDGLKLWDKDAFNITWNSDDSEVSFTFAEERFLPADRDSARQPDYLVQFNPGGDDRAPDWARKGGAAGTLVRSTFAQPAAQVLSAPVTLSWLDDFAAFRDRDADGHRREAERTRGQADEWRELAGDARSDAERNRRRADDARRDGRENDARDWDKEAERDEQRAGERDAEANRLDKWSDEQRQREENARRDAQERRDAAEREREKARQAERDRAERVRREAEEKARVAREEREARRAKEAADREARRLAAEDKERARQREIARQREAREREHRARLDAEQRARDQRARGSSSDADLAKAAADRKKKKEEEEQASLLDRFADLVISVLDGNSETPEEKLLQATKEKLQEKLEEKLKEEALKRTGLDKAKEKLDEVKEQLKEQLAEKLDDLGLDAAAGKLGEGVETLKKIKEIGDWMNAELDKNAGRQRRQVSKVDMLSDPNSRVERLRGAGSGTIAGRDVLDVYKGAVEILKP